MEENKAGAPQGSADAKKLKQKKIISNIIIIAAVAVLIVALVNIYLIKKEDMDNANIYDGLRAYSVTPADGQEVSGLDRVIDFDALRAINPDIIAWILCPEAGLDYPVVQGDTNDYYMSHSADKTPNRAGAIFMEVQNSADFSDPNTILYGHRMNDGSMFGSLRNYEDEAFFDEIRYIAIYTPEKGKQVYEVFATYTAPDNADSYTLFSQGGEEFQEYINKMLTYADFDAGIYPTADDNIITLSTCVQHESDKRFIVQAVLLEEDPTAAAGRQGQS